jgi:predicted transcriptional regulator
MMQPMWDLEKGFGFTDDVAACLAAKAGLIESFNDDGMIQYRVTEKGKEFLNGN